MSLTEQIQDMEDKLADFESGDIYLKMKEQIEDLQYALKEVQDELEESEESVKDLYGAIDKILTIINKA